MYTLEVHNAGGRKEYTLDVHTAGGRKNTPWRFILLVIERKNTLDVHSAGGTKEYTLDVQTAGGGKEYTLDVHTASGRKECTLDVRTAGGRIDTLWKSILMVVERNIVHFGGSYCWCWKGYTLDVYTAGGRKEYSLDVNTTGGRKNTPRRSILLLVERNTP